ncbi:conserved oligomeric Golgi complex subunit 1-like isoform X2 [Tachypleus tridentatus]|uniref:conserved oligomeric Golgi complex subunit 1-like isoform X2 n=2 Tax=Tachypleus tridentatus TaxID=6853 RepID=UPI003FD3F62E
MPNNKISAATVVKLFPVINQQWAVISPFQTSILQVCQNVLTSQDIPEEDVAKALACIVLLRDSTPDAVFREYMEARKVTVQQIFKPERQGTTAKILVCELVLLVMKTLHAVHRVCYAGEETTKTLEGGSGSKVDDLLIKTLSEITRKDSVGPVSLLKLDKTPISKFLPTTITDFRPSFKSDFCSVHPEVLKDVCQQWTDQVSRDVEKGLWELLECIRTMKGVANIRDGVFEVLCQNDYTVRWEQACHDVLGKSMSIWETFLRPVFIHRIKDLLSSQLKSCSTNCKSKICQVLEDLKETKGRMLAMERDVTMYIWTELPSDCTTNLAWTPYTNRTLWESGSLAMKAKGHTPKVQYLCSDLDNGLKKLLEDMTTFVCDDQKEDCLDQESLTSCSEWKSTKLININKDKKEIDEYLRSETKLCIQSIMQYIEEMALTMETSGSGTDVWPVFLGRLTVGMAELCPHLQQCLIGSDKEDSHHFLRITQNSTNIRKVEETYWEEVKSQLLTQSASLFGVWAKNLVKTLCGELEMKLLGVSPVSILSSVLEWEEIEIQEETEGGQTVKSTIQIPLQVSLPLQSTMFHLCQAINRAAGHSLNRLKEITSMLLEHVLDIYATAAKETSSRLTESSHLRQTWAHQLLFDVRYLAALFRVKERNNVQHTVKLEQVVRDLESLIDPFDLDVFSPHFKMNLSRALQGSSLVLGLAVSGDLAGSWDNTRPKPQTGRSDHHNVLPLMSGLVKFPLLPISMEPSKPLIQPPQHLRSSTVSQSSSSGSKAKLIADLEEGCSDV